MDQDTVLDPAHDGSNVETNVAGIPKPDPKPEEKPADEFKVSEDGNVAEHGGRKYIRQEALHEARQKLSEYQKYVTDLEPFMPEFQQYLQAKANRRDQARVNTGSNTPTDEESYLDEVALALGYYDEKNEPDRRRAQAHLNVTRREAEREARRHVEPWARSTQEERAQINRERARSQKYLDGRPVAEQKYIDAALDALGNQHIANPDVANLAMVVAAGLESLDHRRNGTTPRGGRREPMYTERGSRFDSDNSGGLSDFDIAAARARGKTPEQWNKMSKLVNKERDRDVLEEV